jgi:N-acetylglucosaminyldiphosphoundecaprenol N-acetyl-beta-D-mannosaminyltransferase
MHTTVTLATADSLHGTIHLPLQLTDRSRVNVLGVGIDAVGMEQALALVSECLRRGPKGYVCAADVHGVLQALHNGEVASAFTHASIVLPDGAPTVWVGRLQGYNSIDHVTGPAIMREIFRRQEFSHLSHFFYGGNPGVADELALILKQHYPWTKISGTYTPPFRDLTTGEELQFFRRINRLRPDMIWVGISTPRQLLFMHRILSCLDTGLMFGVGAAFDFLTGHVRECPYWIKRAGFHWLHRLLQEPKRLWRRNLLNTAFLWHIALQMSGLRAYHLHPVEESTTNAEYSGRATRPTVATQ